MSDGDLALKVLPGGGAEVILAKQLGHHHLGRLVAIETPAAIYVGNITSVSFFKTGSVYVGLKRNESESKATIGPDNEVHLATEK